jgi:hypothetical protein
MKEGNNILDTVTLSYDVETTFRGEFPSLFRDKSHKVRFDVEGNLGHLGISRHLKVKLGTGYFSKKGKISVLDVTPILTKMNDQAVCPCQLHEHGGCQWIGIGSAACLSQGRHMVNVHA